MSDLYVYYWFFLLLQQKILFLLGFGFVQQESLWVTNRCRSPHSENDVYNLTRPYKIEGLYLSFLSLIFFD
jgi:hypothetical protein